MPRSTKRPEPFAPAVRPGRPLPTLLYMNFTQRFRQLDRLLDEHAWLWRPQPFKTRRPEWCDRLPQLCGELLALSDEELAHYTADQVALVGLLAKAVPELAALLPLTELSQSDVSELADPGPHFPAGIPGRKWNQIVAFSRSLTTVNAPLLEWCGGKGHLGRLLAFQWRQPVLTLERDGELCEAGEGMARRVDVPQRFERCDVLQAEVSRTLPGRHAVALHACGELHRSLVQRAVEQSVPALDIAPCCYHLHGEEHYTALTPGARLTLSRDDRRIAVTETVTAVGREVERRDREMAWKLGFDHLRRAVSGEDIYRPIRPIDKQWLNLDFAGFCRALAQREGVSLEDEFDWQAYEALGWQRRGEIMRLSLVRHAFRRALELWLVLDLACYLEANGYRVGLGTFCERELSPRNILLSARHC